MLFSPFENKICICNILFVFSVFAAITPSVSASAEVTVEPSGTLVLIRNAHNITVDCTAFGKPRPSVTWFKGREEVRLVDQADANEVVQVLLNSTAGSPWTVTSRLYLSIAGASYDDAGNYSCLVHNGVGHNTSLNETVEVLCKYGEHWCWSAYESRVPFIVVPFCHSWFLTSSTRVHLKVSWKGDCTGRKQCHSAVQCYWRAKPSNFLGFRGWTPPIRTPDNGRRLDSVPSAECSIQRRKLHVPCVQQSGRREQNCGTHRWLWVRILDVCRFTSFGLFFITSPRLCYFPWLQ